MAVKIRLRRMGAKKQPFYRLVVADSRAPRDGRCLDEIGTYNPRTSPATLQVSEEKALEWMRRGAQPSATVRALLSQKGLLQRLDEERRAAAAARRASAGR